MIFKRGKSKGKSVYYIQFTIAGRTITRSARTVDKRLAEKRETALKAQLLNGNFGILERQAPTPEAPSLSEYTRTNFMTWAEGKFKAKPKTWFYYRNGVRRILECSAIANVKLDALTTEHVDQYVAHRQSHVSSRNKPLEISTINRELQVLRRILNRAIEQKRLSTAPKIELLNGENHREFVLQPIEEAKYLAVASEALASVATVLCDTGLRPEEAYRLRWEEITWANGRSGSLRISHGKTAAARRVLPMSPRVRETFESRWNAAGQPFEGWVWSAATKSGHIEPSTLKKQHSKAIKVSGVRPFVLYSLRHTFLTRLGLSGRVDVWTLARIAGHSSIKMSERYVHPTDQTVLDALEGSSPTVKSTDTGAPSMLSA